MYDIILEISHAIVKNGLNLSALGTVLFILLKRRRVKKVISRYFPWLAMEPEDVANYEARQIRIEQDVRAIKEHLGVTGCVERIDLSPNTARHLLRFSRKEKLCARIADVFTAKESTTYLKRRKKQMLKKFTSRKFILAIAGCVVIILNDMLDLNVDKDTVFTFAGILATWIATEGVVDANRKTPEVSTYDAKSLDSVRSDSEDVGHTASN